MEKYQNKYRNESARAPWWDYGWNAAYYVTICTQNREHYFGKVNNGLMRLSHTGVIADILWYEIKHHAQFVKLGDYVIMPNHMHGIVILNRPGIRTFGDINLNSKGNGLTAGRDIEFSIPPGTLHATSPQHPSLLPISPTIHPSASEQKNEHMASISPKSGSLSTILRSYKSAVTRHSRRLGFTFGWQARFHDHIIRDEAEYQRISKYIKNNPANWENDEFYT